MKYQISVTKNQAPKQRPVDESKLGFGKIFTDHMFLMNYSTEKGWHDPRVVPYGPIPLEPSAMVFHYAQELFEGMKAYRRPDGEIQLFRPDKNIERLNNTCDRLCVPRLDPQLVLEALATLIEVDKEWIPQANGTRSTFVPSSSQPIPSWACILRIPTSSPSFFLPWALTMQTV